MTNRRLLRAPLLLALPLAFAFGACSEDLESGGACPALCPGQQLEIIDTLLDPAIAFDTTIGDMPMLGFEPTLLVARRENLLDVRAIIRFDSIVRRFIPAGADTFAAVQMVDSATLDIRIMRTALPLPERFFLEAYDVGDSTLADADPASLLPLFAPERLLGTLSIDSAGFKDTALVRIPIDTAALLDMIEDSTRVLRVGLRIRSTAAAEIRVLPADSGSRGPWLRYRVTTDSLDPVATVPPTSATPVNPLFQAFDYIDYPLVVFAPKILGSDRFSVGGMPGKRAYLRFDLPRWLTDSSTVLQARLELVQDPLRGLDDTVTFQIHGHMGIAGHAVTDLRRAANLLAPPGVFVREPLVISPGDSGRVEIEINGLVSQWRTLNGQRVLPNALVLRSSREGESALAARFFGVNAAPELRPRLRISYVPSSSFTFGRP